MVKTFKEWVIEKYLNKDNPRGDLAYDINRDKRFPQENEYEKILAYIKYRSNHYEIVVDLFKRCWKSYEKDVLINAGK